MTVLSDPNGFTIFKVLVDINSIHVKTKVCLIYGRLQCAVLRFKSVLNIETCTIICLDIKCKILSFLRDLSKQC